jgi:hypothetical protein
MSRPWPLTLKNNRALPLIMVIKCTQLYDPYSYRSVSILPTRSGPTDGQHHMIIHVCPVFDWHIKKYVAAFLIEHESLIKFDECISHEYMYCSYTFTPFTDLLYHKKKIVKIKSRDFSWNICKILCEKKANRGNVNKEAPYTLEGLSNQN